MADISQIKLPNGDTFDLVDEKSGYLKSEDIDLSSYMQKGVDYVTAGQKSGTTLGSLVTAEGYKTTASGNYSHAEGQQTEATNVATHAEGISTTANGEGAHAEGHSTEAYGRYSHVEGEGSATNTTSDYAHAEGYYTIAFGQSSHSEGQYTYAANRSQHVFGEYNSPDPNSSSSSASSIKGTYIEIVGNGTSDSKRSNARSLDWSGNEILAGKLTLGANPTAAMDAVTKQYMENQGYLTLSTLPIYNGTVE